MKGSNDEDSGCGNKSETGAEEGEIQDEAISIMSEDTSSDDDEPMGSTLSANVGSKRKVARNPRKTSSKKPTSSSSRKNVKLTSLESAVEKKITRSTSSRNQRATVLNSAELQPYLHEDYLPLAKCQPIVPFPPDGEITMFKRKVTEDQNTAERYVECMFDNCPGKYVRDGSAILNHYNEYHHKNTKITINKIKTLSTWPTMEGSSVCVFV
jgi:hypothetical protein